MKNFKKVLALVLVLATLLGLATMASATEYKDADKIAADYDEAIKVLDLIETMQGYPNGEFRPTANITREEAAKLIAIFDNKDADISTYYTSINPFADEKGRWGESYVGYGYRAGIIAGMNATTFAPTANVTGTQFLKMALVTLGYDQEAEGFVGSSWAVNVLALAKRIGLIDDLADGWKPENDLTRQEAAQILLNTLNAETVEYGQETKALLSKTDSITWIDKEDHSKGFYFNGKLYLTVAGAVKTGKHLYEDFDLTVKDDNDAFMRPYTKWTLDDDSVKTMKAPKATFTTKFTACELLVALGIKETDTDTEIVIDDVYVNGVDVGSELYNAKLKDTDNEKNVGKWSHDTSKCDADDYVHGAQGTLTQVFLMDTIDGVKHYRVTSIDTWLAEVKSVTKKTTARDEHLRATGSVSLSLVYTINEGDKEGYSLKYCNGDNEDNDARFPGQCHDLQTTLTYDDPTDLAKDDYVLITYSFKEKKNSSEVEGVQSADVVTGKDGRFNGFKSAKVADDPTETRIDGEFVKDAVHFHLGYKLSKDEDKFGTYTFYYDAYGNVIGMEESKDTSNWAVIDRAWTTFDNEGETNLNVKVVDLDAKTTTSTAKKFENVKEYAAFDWDTDVDFDDLDQDDLAYTLAVALKDFTNGESKNDFKVIYDHLVKVTVDSNGKYSIKAVVDGETTYVDTLGDSTEYTWVDTENDVEEIVVTNSKPYLKDEDGDDLGYVLTSKTQFLVHKMDGTYESYTGYKNVPSMIAHYAEIVVSEDTNKDHVAEVVYLCDDVYMTDGKVVAYVGKPANMNVQEVKEDTTYYGLTIYVDGEAQDVYVDADDLDAYFTKGAKDAGDEFVAGFYELQNTEIDGVTIAKVLTAPADRDTDDMLKTSRQVKFFETEELELIDAVDGIKSFSYAKDMALYLIAGSKVVKSDLATVQEYFDLYDSYTELGNDTENTVDNAHEVYMDINSDDEITALYFVCASND